MTPRLSALNAAFDILTAYMTDECPEDDNWEDFDSEIDELRMKISAAISRHHAKDVKPTFVGARDEFDRTPSKVTAGEYLRVAMDYEAEGRINDDTFRNALGEIQTWLEESV